MKGMSLSRFFRKADELDRIEEEETLTSNQIRSVAVDSAVYEDVSEKGSGSIISSTRSDSCSTSFVSARASSPKTNVVICIDDDDNDALSSPVWNLAIPTFAMRNDAPQDHNVPNHGESTNVRTFKDLECQKFDHEPREKLNPFAQFAFGGRPPDNLDQSSMRFQGVLNCTDTKSHDDLLNKDSNKRGPSYGNDTKKQKKAKSNSWIPFRQLSPIEQERVVEKWHGLLDSIAQAGEYRNDDDENSIASGNYQYTLEDRRFQMLVSALLHARCQEPVVRSALIHLHKIMVGQMTVDHVAKLDESLLQPAIRSLQYHNSKANYMIRAAQTIQTRFGGIVPHSEVELKEIPGVGEVFADLLASVNTVERHQKRRTTDSADSGILREET
jgi:endonuclease III